MISPILDEDAQIVAGSVAAGANGYAFIYDVTSPDTTKFDLTLVTAAQFDVLRSNGTRDTWSGLAIGATPPNGGVTAGAARLTRLLQATDVPVEDTLIIVPRLTASTGDVWYGAPKVLKVVTEFQL